MVDEKKQLQNIKNPEKPMAFLGGAVAVIGALLFITPYVTMQFGAYGFYFKYFGGIFFVIGLFMVYYYGKKSKDFNRLLTSEEEKILWVYDDGRYESYVAHIQKEGVQGNKQKLIILLIVTVAMLVMMFFVLPKNEKLMVYLFAIGMFGISSTFIYILPLLEMRRINNKPYCTIVTTDEAFSMGTYHRWKECKAKVKEGLVPGMTVLAFTYEGMTANGKMTREWHALLPSEDQDRVEEARQMAVLINRKRKRKDKDGQRERSFLDRLILKALNRDHEN
ncbi:MAG: hypothetical protein GX127_08795 [Eubacteriaceae bacterium]|nr:hypothetical protein [Eubacteriaceae bacterium]